VWKNVLAEASITGNTLELACEMIEDTSQKDGIQAVHQEPDQE
jgi:flavodoxin